MDLVSYAGKHNEANGEDNRDGHNENHSWNNGVEGATADPEVLGFRRRDVMGLRSTLFASRGAIMLTAGDEVGRSQRGNNNAYCQDNTITWVDWSKLDGALIAHIEALSHIRARFDVFRGTAFFTGNGDVEWLRFDGQPMTTGDWEGATTDHLVMLLSTGDAEQDKQTRLAIAINRSHAPHAVELPVQPGGRWQSLLPSAITGAGAVAARSVSFHVEILCNPILLPQLPFFERAAYRGIGGMFLIGKENAAGNFAI